MKRKQESFTGKALILMAAMLPGLLFAGCGKTKEATTTAQKEFVYVPEFQKLEDENGYMDQITLAGDTIYYVSGEYDEETQTGKNYLCSLKIGETSPKKALLDINKDSSIMKMFATSEGELKAILFTWLYDGETEGTQEAAEPSDTSEEEASAEKQAAEEDAEAGEASESEDESASEEEAEPEATASASSGTVIVEETGEAAVPEGASASASSTGEDSRQEPSFHKVELCTVSPDGKVEVLADISGAFEELENSYIQYAEADKDGNLYLSCEQTVIVLDKNGTKICDIKTDNWISGMFSTRDGEVMATYYGADNLEVHPVDLSKKAFGDALTGMIITRYGNYVFGKGKDTDVLFSADNILYSYNMGEEAPVEILNWIDCDINANDLRSFMALEDGRILAVTSSYNGESSSTELVYLTKKKGSEVPEKEILTYGTLMLGFEARQQVIDFNKNSQEYRIEVKEYMAGTDDWQTAVTQMNTDIISGKCPDIMDLSAGNMRKYSSKGVLEDLYPFMDKDPELKREDYLENILKAYEVDGKLYAISDKFYINTVLGKVSEFGERSSITLDELIEMAENLPEGTELYDYATREFILSQNIDMNMDRYIDWKTGECRFNGEDFIKALEFAASFESQEKYMQNQIHNRMDNQAERLHNGTLKMMTTSISSVQEYQMMEGMFGEPVAFIGYPTSGDNGSFIGNTGSTLGMSSKSNNKEGAWQYIRSGLTKEAQEDSDGDDFGFPIMKSALEKRFEKDMEEEYDEMPDGTKVKRAKTNWGYGDFNMEIFAATQEQVDVVRKLIDSLDTLYQYDEEIEKIITEEASAFFEGQKTAKDVAEIIQNRVQVYVNENR